MLDFHVLDGQLPRLVDERWAKIAVDPIGPDMEWTLHQRSTHRTEPSYVSTSISPG